jgi:hypothetical protein
MFFRIATAKIMLFSITSKSLMSYNVKNPRKPLRFQIFSLTLQRYDELEIYHSAGGGRVDHRTADQEPAQETA